MPLSYLDEVLREIRAYWGGMLKLEPVTFWEEYDPEKPLEQQYEMYGSPFGKILCNAWAASPIYLLARYFVSLLESEPGGKRYALMPKTGSFHSLHAASPGWGKQLRIKWEQGQLRVLEV